MQIGAAATHVLLDAPTSVVVDQDLRTTNFASLVNRATLYGELIATPTGAASSSHAGSAYRPTGSRRSHGSRPGSSGRCASPTASSEPTRS